MRIWSLQNAKARLSELINSALHDGVQIVTRRGEEVVAVIPVAEYERITANRTPLSEFLLSGPRVELNIERDSTTGREIEL